MTRNYITNGTSRDHDHDNRRMQSIDQPEERKLCAGRTDMTCAVNCIMIAPKRLKLRLSGLARKSQKRFRDTPRFKGRFGSNPAVFITQRRETGRPIPVQMQKHGYYAIRSRPYVLMQGVWSKQGELISPPRVPHYWHPSSGNSPPVQRACRCCEAPGAA